MKLERSRRRAGRLAALALVATVAVVIAATLSWPSSSDPQVRGQAPATLAAFTVPEPEPLRPSRSSRWATVERPVTARATPGGRRLARLATETPEGTSNLVLVKGRAQRHAGALWVHVQLPVLPNNTTGWVPRSSLGGYHTVDTRLVVDRERLEAVLFKGDRRVFRAPVGVGREQWPTPAGSFYVRVKLTSYKSPFYGPLAFGTSARSAVLTDWPAGGFVGIHGTDQPELLPGRVSHGCIRMRNKAILELGRLMPVGTPVTVT